LPLDNLNNLSLPEELEFNSSISLFMTTFMFVKNLIRLGKQDEFRYSSEHLDNTAYKKYIPGLEKDQYFIRPYIGNNLFLELYEITEDASIDFNLISPFKGLINPLSSGWIFLICLGIRHRFLFTYDFTKTNLLNQKQLFKNTDVFNNFLLN